MDTVTIQAVIAAHGLRKGDKVTVAETPTIAGAISNGVFKVLDRVSPVQDTVPPSQPGTSQDETPPDGGTSQDDDEFEQDLIRAMTEPIEPEVAADNSTVVPSPQPGTRKRRG